MVALIAASHDSEDLDHLLFEGTKFVHKLALESFIFCLVKLVRVEVHTLVKILQLGDCLVFLNLAGYFVPLLDQIKNTLVRILQTSLYFYPNVRVFHKGKTNVELQTLSLALQGDGTHQILNHHSGHYALIVELVARHSELPVLAFLL